MLIRSLVIVAALAGTAGAHSAGASFDADPMTDAGSGGIVFDGSPRFAGHTCNVCHVGGPATIGIRLEADHPELFTDGWKAKMQYHLRVVLQNEWAGVQYTANGADCGQIDVTPFKPCNDNGFALEIDDALSNPIGTFTPVLANKCDPTGNTVYVTMAKNAVTHQGGVNSATAWDVCWTAPDAGTGPVTAYLAVVDGNGGRGTKDYPNDVYGDDVASGSVPIPELGAVPDPQFGGCSAGGDAGAVIAVAILGLVLLRKKLAASALALAAIGGCVHVKPHQRETLAKRNMKFSPDPAEDQLDLHMQEAREGSSGGYGSSGGGCGCN